MRDFLYKPNLFDIDNSKLSNLMILDTIIKNNPIEVNEDNEIDYNKQIKDFNKRLMGAQLHHFKNTLNHPRIDEMLVHIKDKAFILSDFAKHLSCIAISDYEIPFENPNIFDDDFRLFLDHYIPLLEGENDISLEWVQTTIKALCVELGMKVKNISIGLQMAVTGSSMGVSGWHVMSWIGPSSTVKRLTRAYFYNLKSYTI